MWRLGCNALGIGRATTRQSDALLLMHEQFVGQSSHAARSTRQLVGMA
jgi:hypothetical protein